ncbi:hypothetical protein MTR_3g048930 [Medicago truncatula]|uniref:Uncharacterized protein n=1 Tax=Medicago truncatula TaxID=3880 RepID=G7IZY6_MEDTR|nr:hypothetical protein MTR_3g048930 [Medicago truncatula]
MLQIQLDCNIFTRNQSGAAEAWWAHNPQILEFALPEVSGSIPSGANFGGLSPYRACSGFKRGPRKWAVGLVPSD